MNIDGKGQDDEEEGWWCRFEYEFMPDFCYTCGTIGHGEKIVRLNWRKKRNLSLGVG